MQVEVLGFDKLKDAYTSCLDFSLIYTNLLRVIADFMLSLSFMRGSYFGGISYAFLGPDSGTS